MSIQRFLGIWLLCVGHMVAAQPQDTLDLWLEKAQRQVEAAQYAEAVRLYTYILQDLHVLPGQMCFFFGKALYYVRRLEEGARILRFYKDRVRLEDPYQEAATVLLTQIDADIKAIRACTRCNTQGYRYQPHAFCKGTGYVSTNCAICSGYGTMICTYCYGQGILIQRDLFRKRMYKPCPHCQAKGVRNCHTCQGTGSIKEPCKRCRHSGQTATQVLCNHREDP